MTNTIKEKSIRTKFLASLVILGIISMVVLFAIIIFMFEKNERLHYVQNVKNTEAFYHSLVNNDIKMLSAALDSFADNTTFSKLFVKKDRNALQKAGAKLFSSNRKKYGITHHYYINEDGTCFLRMHQPPFFGDVITRTTFKNAKETQSMASGIELGKTAYAIRVVRPYFLQGKRVGYIEFGEEIDHFDNIIKKQLGSDVVVLGVKSAFNEQKYRNARKKSGTKDKWDTLKNYVILSDTLKTDRDFKQSFFKDEDLTTINSATFLDRVDFNGRVYMRGVFPFYDVNGKKTGLVYVLSDVTHTLAQFRLMLLIMGSIGLVLFIIVFYATFRFLQNGIIAPLNDLTLKADQISHGKNLEEKIHSDRNDEIGKLIRSFDRMRTSVYMAMERFKRM